MGSNFYQFLLLAFMFIFIGAIMWPFFLNMSTVFS